MLPPLLSSRSDPIQIVLVLVVPALFGLAAGIMLGLSEPAYLALSLLGVLGGFGAGLEHLGAREGAIRGLAGGVLFGTFILAGHDLSGLAPKAHLPEPEAVLVVLTTLFGSGLGAAGGLVRVRRVRAAAA
jgi:hypothetical protein